MSQPNNDHPYEIAHLVARLAGEEGPGHPRQKAVRWLESHGLGAKVGGFNQDYVTVRPGNGLSRTHVAVHHTLSRSGYSRAEAGRIAYDITHSVGVDTIGAVNAIYAPDPT